MLFGEPAKVQVGKDVAQQDQSPEAGFLQKFQRVSRPAYLRSQMQVGNDYRIEVLFLHAPSL